MPSLQMVAVHYANRSGRGKAALFVPLETAREWVDARLAVWSKGAKYINLTKSESQMTPSQRSCQMGESVMMGCVLGNESDMACRDSWGGLRVA